MHNRAHRPICQPYTQANVLPTYSPWLNTIEMAWRHFRTEVTYCELFATKQALLAAARDFFDRYN